MEDSNKDDFQPGDLNSDWTKLLISPLGSFIFFNNLHENYISSNCMKNQKYFLYSDSMQTFASGKAYT